MSEAIQAVKKSAVSRLVDRVFSRGSGVPQLEQRRELPAFVEEEIKRRQEVVQAKPRRVQTSAMYPNSGQWGGGLYYSDGQKFRGGIVFSGSSPVIDHNKTRANSREAYHSSPYARAIVSRFVEAVVGDGIRLEPKPAAALLGLTQEEAESWARDVKERFGIWASSRYATLDESMNLYQLQRLAALQSQRDGEYFIRFNYLDEPGRINPLCLNPLEQSQLVGNPFTTTQGLPWTNDGIVRDERGREIAYQIKVKDTKGFYKTVTIPAIENGRRQMVHGFTPEYSGQGRGYSPLHHVLQEFSQHTNFAIATIQKAIIQASIVLSKETEANSNPTGSPFAAGFAGAGPVLPPPIPLTTMDDTVNTETVPDYRPVDVALSPGGIGIFNNGPGEKLKAFDHTAPSDSFGPFTEAFVTSLGASCSIPYELVVQKFSSNYSASRAALVMFYRYALILRGEHKSDFLLAVQEAWLSEEIAAGRITAKGWLDPLLRQAWLVADWSGPQMPDIDPTKSISAARDAIEANLSNVSLEAQKYNGTDAAMNRAINERVYDGAKPAYWSTRRAPDSASTTAEPIEPENQNEEPENQEEDENAEALNGRR